MGDGRWAMGDGDRMNDGWWVVGNEWWTFPHPSGDEVVPGSVIILKSIQESPPKSINTKDQHTYIHTYTSTNHPIHEPVSVFISINNVHLHILAPEVFVSPPQKVTESEKKFK